MKIIQGIIDSFGGLRPLARKLDVTPATITDWRERGSVPRKRQQQLLDIAAELGIDLGSFRCSQCGRFYNDT